MPTSVMTEKALAETMRGLMKYQPFSKISVGDICEQCGVSRKTFYYHFKDKFDLVNRVFAMDYEEITGVLGENPAGWDFLEELCGYFYKNREFYINAFSVTGQNSFTEFFEEFMQPKFLERFRQLFLFDADKKHEFLAVFFTDAIRVSVVRWLKESMTIPPEEYLAMTKEILISVAEKVLSEMT